MKFFLTLSGLCAGLAATSLAAESMTALQALKALTKEQKKAVARMEGLDGTPAPERWHVLVHDPAEENGFKEFVVTKGTVVATRNVSQFAERLSAGDVVGDALIRYDSDRIAKSLQLYAQANRQSVAQINYELRREGAGAAPLWKVTGFDQTGKELGSLVVSAEKGAIISHEGFLLEPGKAPPSTPTPAPERFRTSTTTQFSRDPDTQYLPPVAAPATPAPKKPGMLRRIFPGRNRPAEQ